MVGLAAKQIGSDHLSKARWMLETFVFPYLGSRPISEITAPDLLDVLRKIEERGIHETVYRVKQRVGEVFRYGIATWKTTRDITQDLRGALVPVVTQNYPAIVDPHGIAHLLRAIDGYQGQSVTEAALNLAPLLFARPGELRAAEWRNATSDAPSGESRRSVQRSDGRMSYRFLRKPCSFSGTCSH